MPLYEYRCQQCGETSEFLQRFDDPPKTDCPKCGGSLEKLLSAPAFHLKGSGWYKTDYAAPASKDGASAKTESGGDDGSAKSTTAADTGAKTGSSEGSAKASEKTTAKSSDTSAAGGSTKAAAKSGD